MAKDGGALNRILDDEFLLSLAKSAGVDGVTDILSDFKVIPRAIMSLLISELGPMNKGEHKEIPLPFTEKTLLCITKNSGDDYSFIITEDGGRGEAFHNRNIPNIGRVLISEFGLYDLE